MGFQFDELAQELGELWKAPFGDKPIESAKSSLLDWLGVAIAGAKYSRSVLQSVVPAASNTVSADSSAALIGYGRSSDPVSAALHNGIAGHVLDFDDVLITRHFPLHPTAPIAPAVLAAAQSLRVSGMEVLKALTLGVETAFRLAQKIDSTHFAHGWHPTATLGTVGASVGAGFLLGLNPQQLRKAIWLGATQMAGTSVSLGTFAKPFQVGKAASTGLTCALLARANAPLDACMDRENWLRLTYSMREDSESTIQAPRRFAIEAALYKRYPCCGETHDAINSVLHMDPSPPWRSIQRIRIFAPKASLALAGVSRPTNGLAARFSIGYCTVVALVHRKVGLAEFEESAVVNPGITGLLECTELIPHSAKGTRVELDIQDGTMVSASPDPAKNLKEIATRLSFVRTKFINNAKPLVGQTLCDDLMESVSNLSEGGDVKRLYEALRRIP